MSDNKPKDVDQYKCWLQEEHGVQPVEISCTYYESVTAKAKNAFETSPFWTAFTAGLKEFNDEYYLATGYQLFVTMEPRLYVKSHDSFLLKTYRKNVIENAQWPSYPEGGWLLPENWYSRINDILRALFAVKYLDGVEFLINKIASICLLHSMKLQVDLEAKEEGYYAGHLYTEYECEVPKVTWDTRKVCICVEMQITTQLQEVIRQLLHQYYEQRRQSLQPTVPVTKWQWDYTSDEFIANYLGHILHYVEGMIMDVRTRQKNGGWT